MADNDNKIILSQYTKALIEVMKEIKPKSRPDDVSALSVSQTVSFFALAYEKVRNAVEYRDDHLMLRAAIDRILKRRLALNPEGRGEAENLIRELLWARYFDNSSLGGEDIVKTQNLLDKYVFLKQTLVVGRPLEIQSQINQFLFDIMTCEIEEGLKPSSAQKQSNLTSFIFQVLRKKIKIEGLSEEQKDSFFLVSIEKVFAKSDRSYLRYHLFITFYKPFFAYSKKELEAIANKLPVIFKKIDDMIANPYVDNLIKFTRKQLPPFLVLFDLMKKKFTEIETVLADKEKLWTDVDLVCREKYQHMGVRIRNLAIRSFIYILLTKMIFALILEYPLSMYIYGEVSNISILINSIFPPILMAVIVFFFKVPGESNTKKIYQRINEIIDADTSFENKVAFMPKKSTPKRPILVFGFTIFYSLTFIITLTLIYELLSRIHFNIISQIIFVFFVSVVTFFSYRIKQITKELVLDFKESIITPVIDFFFMPILSLGKYFSSEIAKLNFFVFIFDFIVEAPFKLLFEVVEEWITFVRKRKEEII